MSRGGRILTVPNAITAFRVVLFFIFWWYAAKGEGAIAISIFLFAWVLDAVDGFLARSLKQETTFGYFFDKVIDRLSLGLGVVLLIRYRLLPEYAFLLLIREVGLLPALYPVKKLQRSWHDTGRLGRVTTLAQGVAVMWLFLSLPYQVFVVSAVAALGALVAFRHLRTLLIVLIACGLLGGIVSQSEGAAAENVRINEVMWDGIEYVELYNPDSSDVSLEGWKLTRASSADSEKEIIVFSGGMGIQGQDYYVIERKEEATDASSSVIASALTLLNSGEQVRLYDASDNLVSTAGVFGSWPAGANTDDGTAMELISGAWVTATTVNGGRVGSPGLENIGAVPTIYETTVVVSEALPNPKGDDAVGEFIELYNPNNDDEDLSGWQLDDASGGSSPYVFPVGSYIASKEYLVVSRNESGIALNNGGDSVRLLDPSGEVHIDTAYGSDGVEGASYSRTATGSYEWTTQATPGSLNEIVGLPTPTPEIVRSSLTKESTVIDATPMPSSDVADISPDVFLYRALPNPSGEDALGEYIELINTGDEKVDISGLQLDDEDGGSTPYTIPEETSIGPGEIIRFTREDTGIALNNTNDAVRLLAGSGEVLQSFVYDSVDEGQVLQLLGGGPTGDAPGSKDQGRVAGVTSEDVNTDSIDISAKEVAVDVSTDGDQKSSSPNSGRLVGGGKEYAAQDQSEQVKSSKSDDIALGVVLLIGAGGVVAVTMNDPGKIKSIWASLIDQVKTK